MVLDAGLYRYELFGYLGIFSSGWLSTSASAPYATYLKTKGTAIANSMHYIYFSDGGTSDVSYQNGLNTMKILKDNGLTFEYKSRTAGHSFTTWKADLTEFIPHLFLEPLTSVYDQQQDGILAFPSPFSDGIEITYNQPFQYTFYSLDGKEMENGNAKGIQTAGFSLPQGSYLLKVKTGETVKNFKVLKK